MWMWQGRKKIPRIQTAFDYPASISYSRDQLNVETDSFLICLASLDQIAVLRSGLLDVSCLSCHGPCQRLLLEDVENVANDASGDTLLMRARAVPSFVMV